MDRNQITKRFDLIYEWDDHYQRRVNISLVKRDQTKAIRTWQLPAAMRGLLLDGKDFVSYTFYHEETPSVLMKYITDKVYKLTDAYYSAKYPPRM